MSNPLNITTAAFGGLREVATSPLWQWDYGQILEIKGLDLPQAFEVHFSNSRKSGETVTQIGTDGAVTIPDMYLTSGADIYCFIFLHDGLTDGETEYVIKIPVRERPEPSDIKPTPVQQDVIDQAIAALNDAVTQTGQDVISADASAQTAAQSATDAQTAAQSAQASATSASGSATTASNAAATATTKASEAAASATNAANAKTSAETAQGKAEAAQTASESAQALAESAAQTATTKATEAAASAASVGEAAQTATAKAAEATASASAASGSATTASTAASTATTKASEASASATAASNAQTAAETAQGKAEDAQEAAEAARDEAVAEVASISGALDDKADIIISNAEGAIATFEDGGDDMPMVSCVAKIEPVQSGSGDPSPQNIRPITGWTGASVVVSPTQDAQDGTIYPISWQSEAGTVYGGTVDLVSGLLTVDRVLTTINDLTWSRNNTRGIFYATIPQKVNNRDNSLMCDSLPYKGTADSVVHAVQAIGESGIASSINTSQSYIYLNHGEITTQVALKEELGNAQITYQLATPQTYQLTPVEVKTLLGLNNIWADTGDVEVEYRADTKLYIEKLTQPTEDDLVANSAITSGQFFMIGNTLYRALANIASGATITVGTNATKMSLSDALNALA